MCVANSMEEAKRLYAPHVEYFYQRCLHIYPGFADAPGYRTNRTVKAGMKSMMEMAQARGAMPEMNWDSLTKAGYVIAGNPDDVAEQLDRLADDLRVGHLMCGLQMGSMPRDEVMYNTQMFAEKVAPKLRNKFSEFEDRWSPKGMTGTRAVPIEQQFTPGNPVAPLVGV
jgi:alkanesulfonate monooxygenase SsuD/methylene tetrahydromethanopterin reductase-like flavin-dependent oxidoreductase (luciferase family)